MTPRILLRKRIARRFVDQPRAVDTWKMIEKTMTPKERRSPDILNGSRKRRITQGSGTQLQDLNRLLKQHKQMQKMMKKMKNGGMANMMRGLSGNGSIPGIPPSFK